MPSRRLSVQVTGADDMRDLSRQLRQYADGSLLRREWRRRLREVAGPAVPAIRANIMAIPSKGQNARRGKPSLRMQMARAVTLQIRTTGDHPAVSVYVSPRKMPSGKKSLPGYFERVPGKERLRHPVFGNRSAWVTQHTPRQGFFSSAVRPMEERLQREAADIAADITRQIEDA
jgi:hypothetical protein